MARHLDLVGKLFLFIQPLLAELLGIFLESQVAFHDQDPRTRLADAVDLGRVGKAVQQLWAQVTFFGVHGPHQDEAGRVGKRDALPLDHVHTHGG